MASRSKELPSTLARSRTRRCSGGSVSSRAAIRACSDAGAPIASRSRRSASARTYWPPRGTTRSRSISERTVSTANSGMPSARSTRESRAASGSPTTSPSRSAPMSRAVRGSRCSTVARRLVASVGVLLEQARPAEQQHEAGEGAHRQEVLEEVQQPVVGVLGVVDHQDDRELVLADPVQERRPGDEQVLTREVADGADAEQRLHPGREPGTLVRVGHVGLEPAAQAAGPGPRPRRPARRRARAASAAGPGSPRRARRRPPPRRTTGSGRCASGSGSQAVGVLLELPRQAGLADAGLAVHDQQRRTVGLLDAVEELLDQAQLAVAADERRLEAVGPLGAADRGHDRAHRPQRHRVGLALHGWLPTST